MKKYKLAFIGGGLNSIAGYPHFVASKMDNRFEVIAGVFSRNKEINKETANYWDVPYIFDDIDTMFNELGKSIDAVVVLTPTPFHFEHVSKAIEKGYKVICEKPLFKDLEEISQFEKQFEKQFDIKNVFLTITYNYIAYPILKELKEMIKNGELGDILGIHLEMPQESFLRPPKSVDYPPWWRKKDGKIPTILLDLASHLFSISYYLTKLNIKNVLSVKNSFSKFGVIDDVKAIVEYENGASGFLWVSKTALGNRNGLKVSVYGTKMSTTWVQESPEFLYVSDTSGKRYTLDRGSNLSISKKKIYNRMIPGHPSGFIEALANLYFEYYKAIKFYDENKHLPDWDLIWTFEKEKLNFEFLDKLSR